MAKFNLYLDDVEVSVNNLYELLDIDKNSIPNPNEKEFEVHQRFVTKDALGNFRSPQVGIQTNCKIWNKKTGMYSKLRIAETVTESGTGENKVKVYKPGQLFIKNRYKGVSNDQEFIYMYIMPDCAQSPFRDEDKTPRYMFKNNQDIAKISVDFERQRARAIGVVTGDNAMTINQLKQIAKGMDVDNVKNLSDDEVKSALISIAIKNPNKFYDACKSRDVIFNGIVQDAIDEKIITQDFSDGIRRWKFEGEDIVVVTGGSDMMKTLRDSLAERAMEMIPRIKDALDGRSSKQLLENPQLDRLFSDFDIKEPKSLATNPEMAKVIKEEDKNTKEEEYLKALYEDSIKTGDEYQKVNWKRRERIEGDHKEKLAEYAKSIAKLETV
jgi:hypothetical protein